MYKVTFYVVEQVVTEDEESTNEIEAIQKAHDALQTQHYIENHCYVQEYDDDTDDEIDVMKRFEWFPNSQQWRRR